MRVISGEARGHRLKAPKGMTTRPMADKVKGAVFSMLATLLYRLDREWGTVLDLYSGSGSIGIEALSRGATWADFVEINAGVCRIIAENLEHTHFTAKARINNRNVQSFLNSPPGAPHQNGTKRSANGLHRRKGGARENREQSTAPVVLTTPSEIINELAQPHSDNQTLWQYDIIFLDPPYADPKIADMLELVARCGLLKSGGLVVIGHSPRVTLATTYNSTGAYLPIVLLKQRIHGDSAFTIYVAGSPETYDGLLGEEILDDSDEAVEDEIFDDEPTEERDQ